MRFYIVRHGNTFDPGDTVTRVGGRTDLPLSRSGETQAEALALHFSALEPSGFSRAHCSSLQRTRQTAEAILVLVPCDLFLSELGFLKEVDYGPDENQPEDAVIARLGTTALKAWDEHAIPPEGWQVDPPALIEAWKTLFASARTEAEPSKPALIVTSNGIARFALQALSKQAPGHDIKLKTGAYGLVEAGPDGAHLIAWNKRP